MLVCQECGKKYTRIRFLEQHQRTSCQKSLDDFQEVLRATRELRESRKRRRLDEQGRFEVRLTEHQWFSK
jgi:hypothetical protein